MRYLEQGKVKEGELIVKGRDGFSISFSTSPMLKRSRATHFLLSIWEKIILQQRPKGRFMGEEN